MSYLLRLLEKIWSAQMSNSAKLDKILAQQAANHIETKELWLTVVDGMIAINRLLQEIREAVIPQPATQVHFTVDLEGEIQTGVTKLIIKDNQKFSASVQFTDAKGNPATVDGAPVWASSNPAAAAVTPSADGLSADVVAGVPGDTQISVVADADLGAGVTSITGTLDLTVQGGDAVNVVINTGAVSDQ